MNEYLEPTEQEYSPNPETEDEPHPKLQPEPERACSPESIVSFSWASYLIIHRKNSVMHTITLE